MTEELLTVGQVSARFGITVRTLHHYDAIGLVPASRRGTNGYRFYTAADCQRLTRVVLLRRLEMPLGDIAAALNGGDDLEELLRQRRESVIARLGELSHVLQAIDTAMKPEASMNEYATTNAQMKDIFGAEFDEAHASQLNQRWAGSGVHQEIQQRTSSYGEADWRAIKEETDQLVNAFATACSTGAAPGSPQADAAVQAYRDHVTRWFSPLSVSALGGMGSALTPSDPFAAACDGVQPGLSEYVKDAIAAYCANATK